MKTTELKPLKLQQNEDDENEGVDLDEEFDEELGEEGIEDEDEDFGVEEEELEE